MCNSKYLRHIHRVDTTLQLQSTAGVTYTDQQGTCIFGDIEGVWFDPDAISNVLSFGKISKMFPTSYDQLRDTFVVEFPMGPIEFSHQYNDIYAFIPKGDELPMGLQDSLEPALQQLMEALSIAPVMTEPEDPVQLVEMVQENKMGFTD